MSNIILWTVKTNDVDRIRSNDVFATLIMMLCPYGHKYKKDIHWMSFLVAGAEGTDIFRGSCPSVFKYFGKTEYF